MAVEKIRAGVAIPSVVVQSLRGDAVDISRAEPPCDWRLIVVYRGRHCPMCTRFLNVLQGYVDSFRELGVDLVAVSADSKSQLEEHTERLEVEFPLYYGLTAAQMRELGMYISLPKSEQETDHVFSEPGLFLVDHDGLVRLVDIANSPFLRPDPELILRGLRFSRNPDNHSPIRGTFVPEQSKRQDSQ